jgi:hypothetical protein
MTVECYRLIFAISLNEYVINVLKRTVNNARRKKREGKKTVNINGIEMPIEVVEQMGSNGGFMVNFYYLLYAEDYNK